MSLVIMVARASAIAWSSSAYVRAEEWQDLRRIRGSDEPGRF